MSIHDMTALEFLDGLYHAVTNSAEKAAFKVTSEELNHSPQTQQRYPLELLAMVPRMIDSRQDPSKAIFWGCRWRHSVEPPRIAEYLELLEEALRR